jgi:protein TonB
MGRLAAQTADVPDNAPATGAAQGGSGSGGSSGAAASDSDVQQLRRIGAGVTAPVLTHSVEPAFSEEAHAAKANGTVLIGLIVDVYGNPVNVHVLRGVGMGLDESAVP